MFYTRRVVDVDDEVTKWSGINGESEIVGGKGHGEAKKRKVEEVNGDGEKGEGDEGKKEELGEEYHHWEKNH